MPMPSRSATLTGSSAYSASNDNSAPITFDEATRESYCFHHDRVIDALESNADSGIKDAKQRLDKFGSNELDKESGVNYLKIFFGQIFNAMALVSVTHWSIQR